MKRIIFLVIAVVITGGFVACGENFSATDDPEFALDQSTNRVQLTQMGARHSETTLNLRLRNVGPGDMQITNLEWIQRPTRLNGYFEGDNSTGSGMCSSDAECGADAVCLTSSGTCRDLGLAPTPITVRSNALHTLNFVITASDEPVACPQPHDDVPSGVRDVYCGELLIETNATNDDQLIENGTARIYFVSDGSSGLMGLSDSFIRFTGASAGGSDSRTFSISNNNENPLTVVRADLTNNADWFEISPAISYTQIEPFGSQTFTLYLNPPAGVSEEDLEFSTSVHFESSSVSTTPSIFVEVTPGAGDVPIIEIDPMQLSFAEALEQPLQVQNHGTATLVIQSISISPSAVAQYYNVYYEGEEILHGPGGIPNLGPADGGVPTTRDLTVEFTPPQDPSVSVVGTLNFRPLAQSPVEVLLLGDHSEIAYGEIGVEAMRSIRVQSEGGPQVRHLPLINSGTTDLVITGLDWDEGTSTDLEDYTVNGVAHDEPFEATVAPGEILDLAIEYAGDSPFPQSMNIQLLSNHAGQDSLMRVSIVGQAVANPTIEASITPSFSNQGRVGEATSFEVGVSGGDSTLEHAQWLTHERPAGSTALLQGVGQEISFVPDVAGTYRISVLIRDGQSRQVQQVLEFEVVD